LLPAYRFEFSDNLQDDYDEQSYRLASYRAVSESRGSALEPSPWSSLLNLSYGERTATGYDSQFLPLISGNVEHRSTPTLTQNYQVSWDDFIGGDRLLSQSVAGKASFEFQGYHL